jgi:hypothetical protein
LLDFLVEEPIEAIVLGPNHVVPVKVPAPECFVLHKLISSQDRRTDRAKARQDLEQAAVIAAALAEDRPDALAAAFRDLPASARSLARRGAQAGAGLLQGSHPPGRQSLEQIARRR